MGNILDAGERRGGRADNRLGIGQVDFSRDLADFSRDLSSLSKDFAVSRFEIVSVSYA